MSTDTTHTHNDNESSSYIYCLISNIPVHFHSKDLRCFFSEFVEQNAFVVFHFLHRKEKPQLKGGNSTDATTQQGIHAKKATKESCCCVAILWDSSYYQPFRKRYHMQQWRDAKGEHYGARCLIQKIKQPQVIQQQQQQQTAEEEEKRYLTNREKRQQALMKKKGDVMSGLAELTPPVGLPYGNVGTPSYVIHENISNCILPPVVVKKLGVTKEYTDENPYRRYGEVPPPSRFNKYDQQMEEEEYDNDDYVNNNNNDNDDENENNSDDNESEDEDHDGRHSDSDDSAEEWERHIALHGDRYHDNNRGGAGTGVDDDAYLYEDEIELKWEKGGSGLVFYTDDVYWDMLRGDDDEREVDAFDVNTSKDQHKRKQLSKQNGYNDGDDDDDGGDSDYDYDYTDPNAPVGVFERHNKGIAKKIMQAAGWQPGKGIGAGEQGISTPVVLQTQLDKRGLGFEERTHTHGNNNTRQKNKNNQPHKKRKTKVSNSHNNSSYSNLHNNQQTFSISSIYDHPFTNPFSVFNNGSSTVTRGEVQQQLQKYYNNAHIFQLPSQKQEQHQQPQQQHKQAQQQQQPQSRPPLLTKLGFVVGGTLEDVRTAKQKIINTSSSVDNHNNNNNAGL